MKSRNYNFGMVAGLILAAGRSSRMGRPKALLEHVPTGRTFLGHLIQTARAAGLDHVFAIVSSDATAAEARRHGATAVVNEDPDRGQLSSLWAGLAAAESAGASAILVMPVDVPLVTVEVVRAILSAADGDGAILRAAYRGRHGHPVLFSRGVFDELRAADLRAGARMVVHADPARVRDVEVDEPGVTIDIDTPEDYRRVFGREL